MRNSLVICGLCLVAGLCLPATHAVADDPSADYIFPAGGQRGTTVEFRVGAHFLHGGCPIEMSGEGLTASPRIERIKTTWFEGPMIVKPASQGQENYPKDHRGTVEIAQDAEPGIYYWRLWTSQGAVEGRPFIVGDLPEIVEHEIDGQPIPQRVTLPVTINGRTFPREDIDIWEFDAEAGQSITCEVFASRFGSPLNSRLEVRGPDGQIVAENYDHFGNDSFLRFHAPQTGSYQVLIHDSSFRGLQEFVYRLTITAGPHIDRVFPLGGQTGKLTRFELIGQQVPTEPVNIQLPVDGDGLHVQYFPLGETLSNPVTIDLSQLDEHVEADIGNQLAEPIAVPAVLNGRIRKPGESDRWTIAGTKDQQLDLQLWTARFGSPLDAVLTIFDAEGKQLAQSASAPDNPIEPRTSFTVPADGTYILEIKDCFAGRGGPEFAYRLRISQPPDADFRLRLPSDALTVARGAETKFKIAIERIGGFAGEVTLAADELPDGVTMDSVTIPADKNDVEVVFKAGNEAKIRASHLQITGTATLGEERLTRRALRAGLPGTKDRDDVLLTVAMPTPFKLSGVDFQTGYAARGTIHRRRYVIDWGDYRGPLTLSLADRQIRHLQGIRAQPMDVAPGTAEVHYPIQIPTWLEMNRTGRTVVMAVGEVEDEDGNPHKVSFSSGEVNDQIIILTAPCPLSVTTKPASLRAEPGRTAELEINVARGVLERQPVTIELLLPEHFRGVTAAPVTIPPDADRGSLAIEFTDPVGPLNMPATVRATTLSEGDAVIAESKIELVDVRNLRTLSDASER